jgi:hypothetical protein
MNVFHDVVSLPEEEDTAIILWVLYSVPIILILFKRKFLFNPTFSVVVPLYRTRSVVKLF